MISIILPAYNENENIFLALKEISGVLDPENICFELVFVNDGSNDNTWNNIVEANKQDKRVHGISFSRNFGKESAIIAGLEYCSGDCAVVMDCDMQHPPETIPEMYKLWKQGFEVVEGIKSNRGKESFIHKALSKVFYSVQSKMSGLDMKSSSDFKLIDRKVIDILIKLPERNTFFRAMSFWVGFNHTEVIYDVKERVIGKSKWNKKSLFKYAINNITTFSVMPMLISFWTGIAVFILGIAYGIMSVTDAFYHFLPSGFNGILIPLVLILSGIILISLGTVGYYIGKVYSEIQQRPKYIISSKI